MFSRRFVDATSGPSTAVYYTEDSGILPDGTDQSANLATLLAAVYAAGGGKIQFGPGTYRFDSAISIPYTAPSPSTAVPPGKALKIVGVGCYVSGRTGSWVVQGGTIFDMRSSASTGKIDCRGAASLELTGITFSSANASASGPFIFTTNTTLYVHHCSFYGRTTSTFTGCDEDAIVLGGTEDPNPYNDRSDAPFQGYGTVIESCGFNRIRRGIYGRAFCNALIADNNWWAHECGGGAAIELDGSGGHAAGNTFVGNKIEMIGYTYGIKLIDAPSNYFFGNCFFDESAPNTSHYYVDSASTANMIIDGMRNNAKTRITGDAGAIAATMFLSSHSDETAGTQYPYFCKYTSNTTGAVKTSNASGVGMTIEQTTYSVGGKYNRFYPVVSGTVAPNLTWTWRDTSDVDHYLMTIGKGGGDRTEWKFNDVANSDIIAPFHLNIFSSGGSYNINIGASTEAVNFNTTGTTTFAGPIAKTLATSLTAAGTDNTNALSISKQINIVTTTASGTGVIFTALYPVGVIIEVVNKGANTLKVYPTAGKQIDALTVTSGGFSILTGATARFVYDGTKYHSMVD